MCYRCKVCDIIVPHGTPLLRHTVYRAACSLFGNHPERQIEQEFPVCAECKQDIDDGVCPRALQLAFQEQLRPARFIPQPPVKATVSAGLPNDDNVPKTGVILGAKVQVKAGKPVTLGKPKEGK
jgi:hypothetical protein